MNFEKLEVEIKFQFIHKIKLTHSIVSTDGRNSEYEVNISKWQFLQKYGEIQSELVEMTEKNN